MHFGRAAQTRLSSCSSVDSTSKPSVTMFQPTILKADNSYAAWLLCVPLFRSSRQSHQVPTKNITSTCDDIQNHLQPFVHASRRTPRSFICVCPAPLLHAHSRGAAIRYASLLCGLRTSQPNSALSAVRRVRLPRRRRPRDVDAVPSECGSGRCARTRGDSDRRNARGEKVRSSVCSLAGVENIDVLLNCSSRSSITLPANCRLSARYAARVSSHCASTEVEEGGRAGSSAPALACVVASACCDAPASLPCRHTSHAGAIIGADTTYSSAVSIIGHRQLKTMCQRSTVTLKRSSVEAPTWDGSKQDWQTAPQRCVRAQPLLLLRSALPPLRQS